MGDTFDAEGRRRIGRDLHDGAAQKLAAAKLILGRGRDPESIDTAQTLLAEAIGELRAIADRLHPPAWLWRPRAAIACA